MNLWLENKPIDRHQVNAGIGFANGTPLGLEGRTVSSIL
jgi:hypothetical protein